MTHYSLEHRKCFSFINKMFPNSVFSWKNISIYQKVTHHLVHSAANLVAIHRCWQLGNQDCPASPVRANLDQHGLSFFFFSFFFPAWTLNDGKDQVPQEREPTRWESLVLAMHYRLPEYYLCSHV